MTGIERLRELADKYAELGKDHTTIDVVPSGMAMLFSSIANQIEREHAEDCYGMVIDHGTVSRVASDMERHVLGHEGMEDSPVVRWARELREALGATVSRHESDGVTDSPYDALSDEEVKYMATVQADAMVAWWWARDHGGLDYVMHEWQSRVPRDRYELMRQRLLDHIAECETALGRRNRRIEELGRLVGDLATENAELRRRAMPEGCEWPSYESGEPVRIGDAVVDELGHAHEVSSVEVFDDAEVLHWIPSEPEDFVWLVHGERVKRPAVLAADGEPLREGETVWNVKTGERYVVGAFAGGCVNVSDGHGGGLQLLPSQLTHERPDSWERLDADAHKDYVDYWECLKAPCSSCPAVVDGKNPCERYGVGGCHDAMQLDLVRRAKALAGGA